MTEEKNATPKTTAAARTRKYGLGFLLLLLAIGALGFFALPPIVKSLLVGQLSEILHRPVSVESVRINPYTLVVEASGLAIQEMGGGDTVAGFDSLLVNVDGSSLFRGGPVVTELRLIGPAIKIVRLTDGRLNFSDLIDEFMARPKNDDPTPAFAINNIQIAGGRLAFDDQLLGEQHLIGDIHLGLPFVSSMRDDTEIFVEPSFSATIDGAPLAVRGRSKPFADSLESELALDLRDVQLARYLAYLPIRLPVQMRSGVLDTDLKLSFSRNGERAKLALLGSSAIKDLAVNDTSGIPLLSFKRLEVRLADVEPFAQKYAIDQIGLEAPELHARVSRQGTVNWIEFFSQELAARQAVTPTPENPPPVATAAKSAPVDWSLGEAKISGGIVRWLDESHGKPFTASIDNLDFVMRKLDGKSSTPAEFAGSWRFDAEHWVRLEAAAIKGGKLDLAKREVAIEELTARGLQALFRRSADGHIEFVQTPALRVVRAAQKDSSAPWKVTVDKYRGENFGLRFEDGAVSPKATHTIEGMRIALDNLSTEPGKIAKVATHFKFNRKGDVDISGNLKAVPLETDLKVAVKTLEILPLEPYFGERLNIDVTRGEVTVNGALQLRRQATGGPSDATKLSGGFSGDITVGDFQSIEKINTTDFVRWKSLHLGHLDVRLQPDSVAVGEVALTDFFARVILSREGKLNLLQIVRDSGATTTEAAAKASPKPVTTSDGKTVAALASTNVPPLPLKIGKITLQNGDIKFSDNFVKPNYSANLKKIGGTISGLSSAPGSIASLDLRGSYDNIAPLSIAGRLNPLAASPYLDIEADVKGVEMTSLSPYSGKYAGYAIDKGKLSVFVKYKIENNQLTAENRLFVDQLTFGNPVDSPDATKLPVTLAVALLKNRNGEIDINLPVAGSLNDPEFSVGGLVVKVIVNLLAKALTSPFALLGSLFGGGEEMSSLDFDAGKALLTASARQRLETLGKALLDRPALKLEIEGHADPEVDNEGLKRDRLERKVARLKRGESAKNGTEDTAEESVNVDAKEYPALLERVYRAEKFPKPRNMVGLVKGLPADEMEKLILANSVVGEDDLRELADQRAKAVRAWLVAKDLPAERLFLLPVKVGSANGKSESTATGKNGGVVFSLK